MQNPIHVDKHPTRNAFTFYEPRYGDTYNVFLDEHDNFEVAYRYINGRNDTSSVITYDLLTELPTYHRKIVEDTIWAWQVRKTKLK